VTKQLRFGYKGDRIELPVHVDWRSNDLDVQDGHWETFSTNLRRKVRLRYGSELYDRILAVTGAFPVRREICTDVIFHGSRKPENPFGFGVLSLWGGRPDDRQSRPREGWNFALTWYYSKYTAVGMEFSYRKGLRAPTWVASYKNWDLRAGELQKLRIVTYPLSSQGTGQTVLCQKMKWWRDSEKEPSDWMTLHETETCRLPPGDFAVALIAHNCSVEFGNIDVLYPE
jgi:hypothetical protein